MSLQGDWTDVMRKNVSSQMSKNRWSGYPKSDVFILTSMMGDPPVNGLFSASQLHYRKCSKTCGSSLVFRVTERTRTSKYILCHLHLDKWSYILSVASIMQSFLSTRRAMLQYYTVFSFYTYRVKRGLCWNYFCIDNTWECNIILNPLRSTAVLPL